jgi:hypothetical protein
MPTIQNTAKHTAAIFRRLSWSMTPSMADIRDDRGRLERAAP